MVTSEKLLSENGFDILVHDIYNFVESTYIDKSLSKKDGIAAKYPT